MRRFSLFLFLCASLLAAGQKRANVWTFGNHMGLDFNATPTPSLISSSSFELFTSSACQKDTGNLLFYVDAFHIFNRYGSPIDNLNSYPVSSVIVPMPGNDSLYYIFFSNYNNNQGLKYTIMNMNLNGGTGGIQPGFRDLYIDSGSAMSRCMLAAVHHANGCDTWVTVHNDSADVFKSYLVTSGGIQSPVISHSGKQFTKLAISDGLLKFATDGSKIASTYSERVTGMPGYTDYGLEIFNFNNLTGSVSANPLNLSSGPIPTNYVNHLQGISFSCDNSKLYFSKNTGQIFQLDMMAGSDTAIVQSKTLINTGHVFYDNLSTLQLGPDHKIYVSQRIRNCIAVIEDPSNPGISCNFRDSVVMLPLATNRCFPQFVESYFYCPPVANIVMDTVACLGDSLLFSVDSVYNVTNYEWQFGDSTSSFGTSSTHLYGAPGNYNASLIFHYNCNAQIAASKQVTVSAFPQLDLGNDTTLCGSDSIRLIAGNDTSFQYAWSTGDSLAAIRVNMPGTYHALVSNNGCAVTDSIHIDQHPFPSNPLPDDTAACGNDTIRLSAGTVPANYRWSTGDTTASLSVSSSGIYRVTVSDSLCFTADSIVVQIIPFPPCHLPSDTLQCGNDSIQLIASTDTTLSYLWSTNDSTSSIVVMMPGVYAVAVTDRGCTTLDSILVNQLPYPVISLPGETSLCGSGPIVLTANPNPGLHYIWSTTDTTQSISVSAPGTYSISVFDSACKSTDSVIVNQYPLPALSLPLDTLLCGNTPLLLTASTGNYTFLWSTSDTTKSILVSLPGIYTVTASDSMCQSTDSVTVNQILIPVPSLPSYAFFCGNDPVFLTAANNPAYSYQWSTNDTSQTISVNAPGLYSVIIGDSICYTYDMVLVSQIPYPELTLPTDTLLCGSGPLVLSAATGSYHYSWSTNETTASILVNQPGIYFVTVTDSTCSANGSVNVTQKPAFESGTLPNVFTPDGDGINDLFPLADNIDILYLLIFDRWGQPVFESTDEVKTWNGKKGSEELNEGTYYYVAVLEDCSNNPVTVKGTVFLKR